MSHLSLFMFEFNLTVLMQLGAVYELEKVSHVYFSSIDGPLRLEGFRRIWCIYSFNKI